MPVRGSDQAPAAVQTLGRKWQTYGVAVVCAVVAAILPWAIEPVTGWQNPIITFLLFSLAAGLAAAAGGLGPALTFLLLGGGRVLFVPRPVLATITIAPASV